MGKIKIGLEIHIYLNTKEKLFCKCKIPKKNSEVNSLICPVCTGQPGAKPMLPNKNAIKAVLKLATLFGSEIITKTNFQRKHYSWPDMPTGFQKTISGGNSQPNGIGGIFEGIGIEEIHLEEDPAAWDPKTGEINYNRAGFPLAELVTKPDFKNTDELRNWLSELILNMRYLNVLNEDFGIKSDVNVSIEESNFARVEIKNVNSLTNIVNAANAEIKRQREAVKNKEKIAKETRRYNEELDTTEFMRSKEDSAGYMFTPEPDLPNLIIDEKFMEEIKNSIPELPKNKREKYSNYNLSKEDIETIISEPYLSEIFDKAINAKLNPKESGLFLRREIPRILNYHSHDFQKLLEKKIENEIILILKLISDETIAYTTAQKLLEKIYEEKFDIEEYIKKENLIQVKDISKIEELVRQALKEAPKAVEDYKSGNEKSLNFIVGIVMRETKGSAKPQLVNEILIREVKKL